MEEEKGKAIKCILKANQKLKPLSLLLYSIAMVE
jgi:hypothetical protein